MPCVPPHSPRRHGHVRRNCGCAQPHSARGSGRHAGAWLRHEMRAAAPPGCRRLSTGGASVRARRGQHDAARRAAHKSAREAMKPRASTHEQQGVQNDKFGSYPLPGVTFTHYNLSTRGFLHCTHAQHKVDHSTRPRCDLLSSRLHKTRKTPKNSDLAHHAREAEMANKWPTMDPNLRWRARKVPLTRQAAVATVGAAQQSSFAETK